VHTYGLASSQLSRLRDAKIPLCACVDTVAASGGYMMAVCADRIISAPFAVLGSIGVVAQIPNIHRFLKNRDVDIELHTAGTNKRTLTLLGENTPEGRKKFKEDLEQTHALFKSWIAERRPELDLDAVADGSIFYGTDALVKGLCDEIATSDDVLMKLNIDHHLFALKWVEKKTLAARLGRDASAAVVDQVDNYMSRTHQDFTRL
jgi:serine protease SohB